MVQVIESLKKPSFIQDIRTLTDILNDIETEKSIELKVLKLSSKNPLWGIKRIGNHLNILPSKVSHILKFDALGLSYRKVGN